MSILRHSLVLSLALAAPALFSQVPQARSLQSENQEILPAEAEQLFALANQARAAQGAGLLQWDPALAEAARRHCLRMAAEGPIAHRYDGELGLAERAAQAGAHFSLIEENVAIGPDPAAIHDEWMHSPGHRANLLNPEVNRAGVAMVARRGTLYAVADYASAVPALTQSQVEAVIAGLMRVSGVAVLRDASFARAACSMNHGLPGDKSGAQPQFIMRWQGADLTRLPQALVDKLASGRYRQATIGSCPPQGQKGAFTAYRIAVLLY
jgi:uncharacterized protein YkwD